MTGMNGSRGSTSRRVSARAALLAVAVTLLVAASSQAEPSGDTAAKNTCPLLSPQECSFRFAYGYSDRDSLSFYTFGPRVAYDLPAFVPAVAGNRIRIGLEMTGSIMNGDTNKNAGEFALSPLIFDYRYDRGGMLVPFVEGGEGIVLTTLDDINIGGPFEFSSQGGGGFHFFVSKENALTFAFRFRHISNAGIKSPNSGLNTYFFNVGWSHFPDRR
jgi:Lipid A 3-O-deacylase (PagL)